MPRGVVSSSGSSRFDENEEAYSRYATSCFSSHHSQQSSSHRVENQKRNQVGMASRRKSTSRHGVCWIHKHWNITLTILLFTTLTPAIQANEASSIMTTNNLSFLDVLRSKYAHQPTFLQSVEEMAGSLLPLFQDRAQGDFYQRAFLAMAEPERTISFRVSWMDDQGNLRFNRGWRVEFNRYAQTDQ
jgi:hypothetical protein